MAFTTLLTSTTNGIHTITINRPDKLNALNKTVLDELDAAMDIVYSDAAIKSVIITGAGPKAFVAGADITEFSGVSREDGMALAQRGQDIFFKIENCRKPVVAAVNGFALGGGCELAMACHFRLAADTAKFGQPEVNLGLIPGYGGTQRLTQLIGKGRALELLMSAAMITAAEALNLGLVNYVTPAADLIAKTEEILTLIQTKAPLAVAGCISAANAATGSVAGGDGINDGYETEVAEFGRCFGTADMAEGIDAFLNKRTPVFTGK